MPEPTRSDLDLERRRLVGELQTLREERDALEAQLRASQVAQASAAAQLQRASREAESRFVIIDAEHAEACQELTDAHAEELAKVRSDHERDLAEIRQELAERQQALSESQSREAKLASAAAEHTKRVEILGRELRSAQEAVAAERKRRAEENAQAKAKLETPVEILRRELARELGGAAEAELAIDVMLAEAGSTTVPTGDHELLAFVEQHLLAELRGHLGQAKADALMDVLAAQLTRLAAPERASTKESDQRRTVRPPTGEASAGAARRTRRPPPPGANASRRTVRPGPVAEGDARLTGGSIQRSVLLIDCDRIARAQLSRGLARAGCEITVRDSCAGIAKGADEFDVIVTEVVGVAIEELYEAFAGRPLRCAIIAWTAGIDGARTKLRAAGLDGVSVVLKESRPDALVAAVLAQLAERKSVAP